MLLAVLTLSAFRLRVGMASCITVETTVVNSEGKFHVSTFPSLLAKASCKLRAMLHQAYNV